MKENLTGCGSCCDPARPRPKHYCAVLITRVGAPFSKKSTESLLSAKSTCIALGSSSHRSNSGSVPNTSSRLRSSEETGVIRAPTDTSTEDEAPATTSAPGKGTMPSQSERHGEMPDEVAQDSCCHPIGSKEEADIPTCDHTKEPYMAPWCYA